MAGRKTPLIFAWAFLGVAVYACTSSLPEPKPKTPEELAADRFTSALFRCERQTKAQLADPDGFDPEPYGQWLVQETATDRHLVTFKARARNAFGGLVWAEFECIVTHDGTGWTAVVRQL